MPVHTRSEQRKLARSGGKGAQAKRKKMKRKKTGGFSIRKKR